MSFLNSNEIQQFLLTQKPFIQESYQSLAKIINNKPIHLYRMATFTKLLFIATRYQVYFYCLGLSTYTLYTAFQKWNETDRTKLTIAAGVAFTSSFLGFYMTIRLGRLLPTNIFYHWQTKTFQISYYNWYCGTRTQQYKSEQFKVNDKRIGLINSTVQYKLDGNKLCTKGPGSWSNISLMDYLLENNKKQQ